MIEITLGFGKDVKISDNPQKLAQARSTWRQLGQRLSEANDLPRVLGLYIPMLRAGTPAELRARDLGAGPPDQMVCHRSFAVSLGLWSASELWNRRREGIPSGSLLGSARREGIAGMLSEKIIRSVEPAGGAEIAVGAVWGV